MTFNNYQTYRNGWKGGADKKKKARVWLVVVSRAFTTYMYSSTAPDTDQVVSEVPASASATKDISFKYFSSSGHAMKKGELPPQRVFTK